MKKLQKKIKENQVYKTLGVQAIYLLGLQAVYIVIIILKIIKKDYPGAFLLFSLNCFFAYHMINNYKKIVRNNKRMEAHKKALQALFDNEKRAEIIIKQCKEIEKNCIKCNDDFCPRSFKNAIHIYADNAEVITEYLEIKED